MWRKAMVYLGLDDAEYEDDYEPDAGREPERERSVARERNAARPVTATPAPSYADEPSGIGSVRPISVRGGDPEMAVTGQTITPSGSGIRPRPQVVRPIAVTPN